MRILVVVPPERFDFYEFLNKDESNEYLLLWYENPSKLKLDLEQCPIQFKEVYYWQSFITPKDLLRKIAPEKIVFFEIIDLRQIALIVTTKASEVSTIYMDHGAAGSIVEAIERTNVKGQFKTKLPYLLNRFTNNFLAIVKAKIFYFSVFTKFASVKSYLMYLTLPFAMLWRLPLKVLAKYKFEERSPDFFILCNQLNLEEHRHFHQIPQNSNFISGVPNYDIFYQSTNDLKNYVVFIDSPYLEENLFNWDKLFHQSLATHLNNFAIAANIKVYIKLHPRSDLQTWLKYNFDGELIEILQFEDCTKLYLESKLIFGYSSSLLTAFICARKNVVLVGWNPKPKVRGFDFAETGLCHRSLDIGELLSKYQFWVSNNLAIKSNNYERFVELTNPNFDGNAGNRIINLIASLEVSNQKVTKWFKKITKSNLFC